MTNQLVFWWHQTLDELLSSRGMSKEGLSEVQAADRLKEFGPNELSEKKQQSLAARFLSKLTNPLILLLLAAAFISAILGQLSDFAIIIAITLISITIDVFQEHQAVEGAEKLRKRVSLTASVFRDGIAKEVPLSHIVPGDLVSLSVGDIVPADCRLLSAKDLIIDQSALTGESFPEAKNPDSLPGPHASTVERTNSVFMGTTVIGGEGVAIVCATGIQTELGHVSRELVAKRPQTEFEKGITDFGYLLAKTALVVAVIVFVSHLLLGHDLFSTLLFVLSLAIGFAPELLPIIITINLSKGALRMSKKGVIVKSLPSIENFGSMDVLCTDKTGTLTENAITLEKYEDMTGHASEQVLELGLVTSLFQTGFSGPMEEAVKSKAKGSAVSYTSVECVPFDFFRKRLSVIVSRDGENFLITKGAPEGIIALSTSYQADGKTKQFDKQSRAAAMEHFGKLSKEGYRTLAIGYRKVSPQSKAFSPADEKDFIYVGLLAFDDPAKKTATAALRLLAERGVETKILTGDHELVTEKICRDIGLAVKGILTSDIIDGLSDEQLAQKVEETTIFARINPTLKQRVISALRKNGHVVGYLGDGINDAPSLREADIGISVNNAVDVAKETADIILLHKDLHVLSDGVFEGRITFANVSKYLNMGMSSNFGNMVSITAASLFLPFLPMLPVQILLNDLLYDVSQLLLAGDSVDAVYLGTPHRWNITNIRRFMLVFGPISSVFDFMTFFLLLYFFKAQSQLFQTGWFLESIVTQTLIIFSIRTQLVPFFKSKIQPVFAASLICISVLVLILPFTPIGRLFSFVPLPALYYGLLAFVVVSYFFLVELVKRWFYTRYKI